MARQDLERQQKYKTKRFSFTTVRYSTLQYSGTQNISIPLQFPATVLWNSRPFNSATVSGLQNKLSPRQNKGLEVL